EGERRGVAVEHPGVVAVVRDDGVLARGRHAGPVDRAAAGHVERRADPLVGIGGERRLRVHVDHVDLSRAGDQHEAPVVRRVALAGADAVVGRDRQRPGARFRAGHDVEPRKVGAGGVDVDLLVGVGMWGSGTTAVGSVRRADTKPPHPGRVVVGGELVAVEVVVVVGGGVVVVVVDDDVVVGGRVVVVVVDDDVVVGGRVVVVVVDDDVVAGRRVVVVVVADVVVAVRHAVPAVADAVLVVASSMAVAVAQSALLQAGT